jgi:hypothetical protein
MQGDVNFSHADYVGRCIDGAIFVICGIAILIIVPHQIRRRIATGKVDEAKGKLQLRLVWPVGCIMIGYGILKIFAGF